MNMKYLILWFISLPIACWAQEGGGLQTINGAKLFVEIMGEGEPIIVVHGGPGMNHDYFLPHLKPLSKNFKLLLYDQRASGKSSIPSTDSISLKYFIEDIESIRKSLAAEKVTILAHSWGAIVAVNYAYQYRHRIKKLILSNPVPLSREYDREMLKQQQGRFTSKDSTDRSIIMGSPSYKSGKASAYQNLLRYSFRHSFFSDKNLEQLQLVVPDNFQKANQSLYKGLGADLTNYNFYELLKSFEFKMLIIHGQADAIPLAAITRMHELSPQGTLLFYNKSGHFSFIEQRKKFIADVTDFILE